MKAEGVRLEPRCGHLNHLTGLHLLEAVHTRDAVTDRQYLADLLKLDLATVVHDLGLDDRRELRS